MTIMDTGTSGSSLTYSERTVRTDLKYRLDIAARHPWMFHVISSAGALVAYSNTEIAVRCFHIHHHYSLPKCNSKLFCISPNVK
jgi:hypothetical protein